MPRLKIKDNLSLDLSSLQYYHDIIMSRNKLKCAKAKNTKMKFPSIKRKAFFSLVVVHTYLNLRDAWLLRKS